MSSIAGRTGPEGSQEGSQEELEATELPPIDKSLHRRLRWGGSGRRNNTCRWRCPERDGVVWIVRLCVPAIR